MKTLITSAVCALAIGSASAAVTKVNSDWSSSLDAGFSLAKGNSDTLLLTLGYATEKKTQSDEYNVALSYAFGENDGLTSTDELLGSAAWRHLIDERNYTGLRADYRQDNLADIDYRIGITGFVGHYFIKSDKTNLSGEIGLGYVTEKAGGITDDYLSVYVGDRFDHALNDKTKIYQSLNAFAPADNFDDFKIVFEAGLETAVSENLNLKIFIQDKYEAIPAVGRDKNDIKLVTGLSYKF